MDVGGRKTGQDHWESVHDGTIRMGLPLSIMVSTLNFKRLLRANVTRPGMKVLEIGAAPGKHLAWVAKVLEATVCGIDYSEAGMRTAERLFKKLDIRGELRCEDVFETTFENSYFDLVYSIGLIEHFDDPRPIVRKHLDLVRPGGCALLVIPNYGGVYGKLQEYFDSENLNLHNLKIMCPIALKQLVPAEFPAQIETFYFGRMSPWIVTWQKRWSPTVAKAITAIANGIGLAMPFDIPQLSPWIVLKVMRHPIAS